MFFLKKLFRDYEVSRDISCIYEVLWNLFECILHRIKIYVSQKKTSAVSCDDIMHGGEYDIEI